MTLGKKMRLIRIEHDLTQRQLAEKMSVGQVHVSQIELSRTFPTEMYIKLFCYVFEIPKDYLLEGVDNYVAAG